MTETDLSGVQLRDAEPHTLPEGGKARRVYLSLRDDISNGAHVDGAPLPGEQRLAESHGVSRVTIRRALEALVADGLIEKRTGAGSIVRARGGARAISADMTTLSPEVEAMERTTEARLLSFAYAAPPAGVAEALGLAAGEKTQTAVRVRLSEGTAFSHLTPHVPERIARGYSEADLATTPLFRLLERGGVEVDSAAQTVTAALAGPEAASALEVSVGSALLSLTRVVRDADGRGVEHLTALYRPDRFRLEMTLSRVGPNGERHWAPVIGGAS
ncbi:MAG: GntR family transcriptional regulator [Pseudomonadota bacterium]